MGNFFGNLPGEPFLLIFFREILIFKGVIGFPEGKGVGKFGGPNFWSLFSGKRGGSTLRRPIFLIGLNRGVNNLAL